MPSSCRVSILQGVLEVSHRMPLMFPQLKVSSSRMSSEELEASKPVAVPAPVNPRVPSVPLAIKFFLTGVVFPISCLIHTYCGLNANVEQPWQSDSPSVYIGLLLDFPSNLAFLPLMLLSMFCITIWAFYPASSRYAPIRLGNYLGLGLCIQVFVMIVMVTGPFTLIAAVIVGPSLTAVTHSLKWVARHYRRFTIRHLLIVTTVVAFLSLFMRQASGVLLPLAFVDFTIVVSAPTLALITYCRSTMSLLNTPSESHSNYANVTNAGALMAAIFVWIASWKVALALMMDEYAKLPTANPNCYVSSAAARGHASLVRSEVVCDKSDLPVYANQQMRRLKFLELALKCGCPIFHRFIRLGYDFVGPPLARAFAIHPLLADAAYLFLMPLEFAAELLRLSLGFPSIVIDRLYRAN